MTISWPLSRQQVLDANGRPYLPVSVNFYAGGTTDPLTVFSDAGLTVPLTQPVMADGTGRFPRVYLPAGLYAEQVLGPYGNQLWFDDNLGEAVVTPSTDPTPAFDPTGVASTGDVKWRVDTAILPGWVRMNGAHHRRAGLGGDRVRRRIGLGPVRLPLDHLPRRRRLGGRRSRHLGGGRLFRRQADHDPDDAGVRRRRPRRHGVEPGRTGPDDHQHASDRRIDHGPGGRCVPAGRRDDRRRPRHLRQHDDRLDLEWRPDAVPGCRSGLVWHRLRALLLHRRCAVARHDRGDVLSGLSVDQIPTITPSGTLDAVPDHQHTINYNFQNAYGGGSGGAVVSVGQGLRTPPPPRRLRAAIRPSSTARPSAVGRLTRTSSRPGSAPST